MRTAHLRRAAMLAVFPLLLAACSGGDGANDEGSNGPTAGTITEPAQDATVVVQDSDLGQIVVDAEGRTLYVLFADKNGKSTCYDDCEATWPPLTVDGEPSGDGVDAELLGTTERDDGTSQVTLNDQPLYYFASDEAPGDMNGQGIGDVWYVVSADGEAITKA